jgi:Triose-phosphate Transporter family
VAFRSYLLYTDSMVSIPCLLFRNMKDIKNLDSTANYAWTTLISVLICVPGALIFEGKALRAGIDAALIKEPNFYWSLVSVGLLYHLYNQVSIQRQRLGVAPFCWNSLYACISMYGMYAAVCLGIATSFHCCSRIPGAARCTVTCVDVLFGHSTICYVHGGRAAFASLLCVVCL